MRPSQQAINYDFENKIRKLTVTHFLFCSQKFNQTNTTTTKQEMNGKTP